jgi:acyl carrier protein
MLLELLFELEEKLGITVPNDFPTPGNVGELVDVVDRIRTQPSEQVH